MTSAATDPASVRAEMERYMEEHAVGSLFKEVVEALLRERPLSPVAFTVRYLLEHYPEATAAVLLDHLAARRVAGDTDRVGDRGARKSGEVHAANAQRASATPSTREAESEGTEDDEEEEDEEEDDDESEYLQSPLPLQRPAAGRGAGRRQVVYSEVVDFGVLAAHHSVQDVPKDAAETSRILAIMRSNKLLSHLSEDQHQAFCKALVHKTFDDGHVLIKQGDPGDYFYIVDKGIADIFIRQRDGSQLKVARCEAGASFGELALLYNAPRAATVIAVGPLQTWAVDRITFKLIMMSSAIESHERKLSFTRRIPIFELMTREEHRTVADSLVPVKFEDGTVIIREGDPGDSFYIIEQGSVDCTKRNAAGLDSVVGTLGRGAYFGEIALLTQRPRQASVIAKGPVRALCMDRSSFTRVMGPLTDILRRNMDAYAAYLGQAQ